MTATHIQTRWQAHKPKLKWRWRLALLRKLEVKRQRDPHTRTQTHHPKPNARAYRHHLFSIENFVKGQHIGWQRRWCITRWVAKLKSFVEWVWGQCTNATPLHRRTPSNHYVLLGECAWKGEIGTHTHLIRIGCDRWFGVNIQRVHVHTATDTTWLGSQFGWPHSANSVHWCECETRSNMLERARATIIPYNLVCSCDEVRIRRIQDACSLPAAFARHSA